MTELPQSLEAAIAQAAEATQAAIADGQSRLQVDLLFPELKPMPVAEQFIQSFADLGPHLKVFFSDAGAAALARRDWGDQPFTIRAVGELLEPVHPEDKVFVVVSPTAVEVAEVEKMANQAGDRPFILLNPSLEDIGAVGLGYTSRQLRNRFLSTFEFSYYLRPLEKAAVMRCYPSGWQVWIEKDDDYQLLAEVPQKPSGEDLDQILTQSTDAPTQPTRKSFLTDLQRFLRALSQ